MAAAPVERGVASAAYSFIRFGGAAVATYLASVLGEQVTVHLPFWVAGAAVLLGVGVPRATRPHLAGIDAPDDELEEAIDEAAAITIGNAS